MSLHHTQDSICPECQEKLQQAHHSLVDWFNEEVKPAFHQAHISWGWRGQVQQDVFFAAGKTHLRWPDSPHNHMNGIRPEALALDLFILNADGKAEFPERFYKALDAYNKTISAPIKWGGEFHTLGDADHYQLI